MSLIDIETSPGSLTNFNPPKVEELATAALISGGFTFPPILPVSISDGNDRISVTVEESAYNETQRANILSILNAVCTDPTRNQQTQTQIFTDYIALNLQYKDVFAQASYVLETGIALLPSPPTLAAYRTVLTNTVTALVPLAGTSFETHFNLERAAQGLPVSLPISSMTLAQCGAFDNLLHIWLNARLTHALIAVIPEW